jgi:hypothetical protein
MGVALNLVVICNLISLGNRNNKKEESTDGEDGSEQGGRKVERSG